MLSISAAASCSAAAYGLIVCASGGLRLEREYSICELHGVEIRRKRRKFVLSGPRRRGTGNVLRGSVQLYVGARGCVLRPPCVRADWLCPRLGRVGECPVPRLVSPLSSLAFLSLPIYALYRICRTGPPRPGLRPDQCDHRPPASSLAGACRGAPQTVGAIGTPRVITFFSPRNVAHGRRCRYISRGARARRGEPPWTFAPFSKSSRVGFFF